MHQKFVCEDHAYYFSFNWIQNTLNDFESRSAEFPHLYENLISFFSNYKLHFNSNSAVLKLFSRPIAQSVNNTVGQLT